MVEANWQLIKILAAICGAMFVLLAVACSGLGYLLLSQP